MKLNVVKILAYGSYKRYMWVRINKTEDVCVMIPDKLYRYLRFNQVCTSQKLRTIKK